MAQIETVRVKVKEGGHEAVINKDQFDATLHTEIKGGVADADNLHRQLASATTIEQVDAVREKVEAESDGRRTSSNGDLLDKIEARRRSIELRTGPKYLKEAPPVAVQNRANEVPYAPYMAPPSPGVALESNGVSPEAAARTAAPFQLAPAAPETPAALDDTRNPKGLGTDVSALAGTAVVTEADTMQGTVVDTDGRKVKKGRKPSAGAATRKK